MMKTNKLILGVLILQTAFIVLLSFLVFGMESRTGDLAYEIAAARLNVDPTQKNKPLQVVNPTSSGTGTSLTSDDTRLIVREELNVFAERLIKELKDSQSYIQSESPLISEDEITRIHASAASQISAMSSFGTATPSTLSKFENTIVHLPPKEREAAMRKFMRAVNQGDIQSNF